MVISIALICIDIESQFGAFNKPFSNTGGLLTYMVPPKTSIIGLLGAIVGYPLSETLERFKDIKIGIEPLKDIKTKTIIYNCHYGGRLGRWVNIRQEVLIEPRYRIYIEIGSNFQDEKFLMHINKLLQDNRVTKKVKDVREGLELLLRNQISYYSLYMGKNDFPLKYYFRDIKTSKLSPSDLEKYFPTNCVIPTDVISDISISVKEQKFGINRFVPRSFRVFILSDVPVSQKKDREFIKFKNFLLKDMGRETYMRIMPKKKEEYSFYIDDKENLIVCF